MSSIDERIVQMKFDNRLFEKNVATSIGTLAKLKAALKFTDVGQGISNVEKAFNNLSFGKLESSVESVSKRFSTMGIAGMTVIQDLTRAAENLGKTLVSATVGQIKTGGWNRASNIAQAKFQLEGLKVAWEDISGDIDYAVSGTAYGMDEAARVASQLVASNIEVGDSMKQALRAVSGVAAMTNSSYSDIGQIFTTVAGNGRLMADQLNQLSYRGLNAAAKLGEALGKSEAEIRDMTSKGEISFSMFAEAMDNAFGEHAKEANKTFTGALANMKAALSRIGEKFATPFQNNMIDVFNAIRPLIDELNKVHFTQLYEDFTDFAEKASGFAINVLSKVDLSWVDELIGKLHEAYTWFDTLMTAINPLWEKVEKTEEKTADHVSDLVHSEEEITELAKKVLAGAYGNGEERRKKLEEEGYTYEVIQNKVNELTGCTKRYEVAEEAATEAVKENTKEHKKGIEVTKEAYQNYAKQQRELVKQKERQEKINELLSKTDPIAKGASSALNILTKTAAAVAEGGFDPMFNIMASGASIVLDVIGGIGKLITSLDEFLEKTGAYDKLQRGINGFLTDTSKWFDDLADSVSEFVSEGGGLDGFLKIFNKDAKDGKKVKESLGSVGEVLEYLFGVITDFLTSDGPLSFEGIVDTITKMYSGLSKLQPILNALYGNLIALKGAGAVYSLLDFVTKLPDFFDSLIQQNRAAALLDLAKAFAVFAVAMFAFANMSWDQINHGVAALGVLAGVLALLWYGFNKFAQFQDENPVAEVVGTLVNSFANANNSTAILKLAGAVAILAGAFYLLTTIKTDGLQNAIIAIGVVSGLLLVLWLVVREGNKVMRDLKEELKGTTSVFDTVKNAIGGLFSTIDTYMRSLANNNNANAILKLAGAVAAVSASMFLLAQLDSDQLKIGALAIGVVVGAILLIMNAVSRFKTRSFQDKARDLQGGLATGIYDFLFNLSAGMKRLGTGLQIASITALVLACGRIIGIIAGLKLKDAVKAVALLGVVFLEIFGVLALIDRYASGGKSGFKFDTATVIYALGEFIRSIGGTLEIIGNMSLADAVKSVALLGAVMLELWGALRLIAGVGTKETNPLKLSVLMFSIGYTVKSLGKALKTLSEIPFTKALGAIAIMGVTLLELWGALKLISGIGTGETQPLKLALLMAAIGFTVGSLGKALKTISDIPFEDAIKSVLAMGAVMLLLAGTLRLITGGKIAPSFSDAVTIASIGVTIGLLAGAIWILSTIDGDALTKAIMAVAAVGGILVAIIGIGTKLSGGGLSDTFSTVKSILPMIVMLGTIVASLMMLSSIPTDKLKASVKALGDILLSVAAMFAALSLQGLFGGGLDALNTGVSFLGIAAIIMEVAGVFYLLQDLDAAQMLSISESLSQFIEAISMMSLAAAAVSLTGGGIAAFGSITGVIAAVSAIEALAAVVEHFSHGEASKFLDEGLPFLEAIARGIGRFIGTILEEGLLKPLNNSFGDIPDQLTSFMTNIEPVLKGFENLDTTGLDQIKEILKKISGIQAEGLVTSVLRFLTGENSLTTFAADLSTFATALNDYCKIVKNGEFDATVVESTTKAMDQLVELANAVPDEGFFTKLADMSDFGQFSKDLTPFAEGLNAFCETLGEGKFNSEVAEKGAAAGSVLAAFAQEVPESSLFEKLTNMTDLTAFANQLPNLGLKLGFFCQNLESTGFSKDAVKTGAAAGELLAAFAKEVPESSLLEKLLNQTDLDEFASSLAPLGKGLGDFCGNLTTYGFDADMVDEASAAASMLSGFAKELPENSLLEKMLGGTELQNFAETLPKLGEGLAGFTTELNEGNFDASAVRSSKGAIGILAEMASAIPDVGGGGLLGWIEGGQLSNFGDQLTAFANGLASYATIIGGVANDDISKATSAVDMVTALVNVFNELNEVVSTTYGFGNAGSAMTAIWDSYDIAEAVSGFFAELKAAFEGTDNDIESLHESMKNVGLDIAGWIMEGLESTSEDGSAATAIGNLGATIAEGLADAEALKDVKSNAEALGEAVVDGLIGVTGEDGSIGGFTEDVITAVTDMIETVTGMLTDTDASMSGIGSTWANNLATGLRGKVSALKSAAASLGNGVVSTLRTFSSNMTSIGTGWGSNIASGISASGTTVRTAGRTLGTTAGQAFTAGYQSTATTNFVPGTTPQGEGKVLSELTESGKAMGSTLVESMGKGIDGSNDEFVNQVNLMADYANAVLNEAIDTTPVITPVLDMSNVQNASNLMGSYFGNTSMMLGDNGASAYARSLLDNADIISSNNAQVRLNDVTMQDTLNGIRSDIKDLGEAMSHMQMVMNNGALVGQIGNSMDRQLGSIQKFKERWA